MGQSVGIWGCMMVRASPMMLFGPPGYQSNSYCMLDAIPLLKVVLRARLNELNPRTPIYISLHLTQLQLYNGNLVHGELNIFSMLGQQSVITLSSRRSHHSECLDDPRMSSGQSYWHVRAREMRPSLAHGSVAFLHCGMAEF